MVSIIRDLLQHRRRRRCLKATSHPEMLDYLTQPPPSAGQAAPGAEYLAVDLEMSGLDAGSDHILSIGYVPVVDRQIVIEHAGHHIVHQDDVDLRQTAPIHHLRDIDLESGETLQNAMDQLLKMLRQRVLIVHHAPLDLAFLNTACEQLYGVALCVPVIDTLAVERRRLLRQNPAIAEGALRLHECRRRYHLPSHHAHNAVTDAIATAELWLAQLEHACQGKPLRLQHFLN